MRRCHWLLVRKCVHDGVAAAVAWSPKCQPRAHLSTTCDEKAPRAICCSSSVAQSCCDLGIPYDVAPYITNAQSTIDCKASSLPRNSVHTIACCTRPPKTGYRRQVLGPCKAIANLHEISLKYWGMLEAVCEIVHVAADKRLEVSCLCPPPPALISSLHSHLACWALIFQSTT